MNWLALLTTAFGAFGAGRSPAALLNMAAPRRGYRRERDIAYGTGPRQRLDVYWPESPPPLVLPHTRADALAGGGERSGALGLSPARRRDRGAPVIVFFYGGAFRAGRKSEYRFVGGSLATSGMIVAIPDYRIYPEARFPEFLQDGAQAIARIRAIAAQFGGDPENLFLAGHSAGAYIAVMLAANERWLREQGGGAAWIRGVIALSGRYHESPLQDAIAEQIFRGPPRDETRPAYFAAAGCPPMLVAAGSRENPVVLAGKQHLAAHLRAHGVEVEEILYPGIGHAGIVAALAPAFRRRAPVRTDIARFVARYCEPGHCER